MVTYVCIAVCIQRTYMYIHIYILKLCGNVNKVIVYTHTKHSEEVEYLEMDQLSPR